MNHANDNISSPFITGYDIGRGDEMSAYCQMRRLEGGAVKVERILHTFPPGNPEE